MCLIARLADYYLIFTIAIIGMVILLKLLRFILIKIFGEKAKQIRTIETPKHMRVLLVFLGLIFVDDYRKRQCSGIYDQSIYSVRAGKWQKNYTELMRPVLIE